MFVCLFNFYFSSELTSKPNKLVSWLLGCVLSLHLTVGQRFPSPCLRTAVHYKTFSQLNENGVAKQLRRLLVGTKTQNHESKRVLQALCSLPTDLRRDKTAWPRWRLLAAVLLQTYPLNFSPRLGSQGTAFSCLAGILEEIAGYQPLHKFLAVISTEKGCILCYLYLFLWPQ